MVSAEVGITLLPALATLNQGALSDNIRLLNFTDSSPSRQIAMCWRKSSAREELFLALAELFRGIAQFFGIWCQPLCIPVSTALLSNVPRE
jgi:LysR family transcriptional regulator, hydrogen peroxide-inducible genes activator